MAKKTLVREYDKFMLRLPPGMRDRIRSTADLAGISMNEAIVMCLDEYFPAPATFEERVENLAEMVAALRHGNEVDLAERIDEIAASIDKTLRDIADDKMNVTIGFTEKVANKVHEWEEAERAKSRLFDERFGSYEDHDHDENEEPPSSGQGDPFALDDGVPLNDKD